MGTQRGVCSAAIPGLGIARVLVAGAAGAVTLLLMLAAMAWGGQYHVYSCSDPVTQAPLPADGWAKTPGSYEEFEEDNCALGGQLGALKANIRPAFPNIFYSWTFSVPAGVEVVGAVLYREIFTNYKIQDYWTSPEDNVGSPRDVFEQCEVPGNRFGNSLEYCERGNVRKYEECSSAPCPVVPYAPADTLVVPADHLPTHQIAFRLNCLAQGCYGWELLHSADIVLEQRTGPTATATGGSLTNATTLKGEADVYITANDPVSGVFQAILQADGKTVAKQLIDSNGGRCNPYGEKPDGSYIFLYVLPCAQSVSNTDVHFSTAQIPEGPHQLSVLVSDAAGNTTLILSRSVTIENSGQYVIELQRRQQELALAARGACNAQCDDGAHLQMIDPKPTAVTFTRIYSRSARTLTGRLVNHAGAAMPGAQIELRQQASYPLARSALVATMRTDAKGQWAFRVPQGPSRTLVVGYRAYSKDATYATQVEYSERVPADVQLAGPRRARPGRGFTFRGRLLGRLHSTRRGARKRANLLRREMARNRTATHQQARSVRVPLRLRRRRTRHLPLPRGPAVHGQLPIRCRRKQAGPHPPPMRLKPNTSHAFLVGLLAGAAVLLAPIVARGEVAYPPSQAIADRGAWLAFAPAPAQPAGICMIDSGVDLNPDTQPEVIYREALDGGDPGDVSPIKHGTLMAMEATAPPNGWGMIGAAPTAVRIVSIRAESATNGLTVSAYKQGIIACQDIAEHHLEFNLKVISMSIGFQGKPSPEQLTELEDAARTAHGAGLDLLAAAGDEGSSMISYPAAVRPIIAVGASGANRIQCSFSNTGPQLALLAPGCELQEANPVSGELLEGYAGDSQGDAITAAVLAALRAYRPDLGAGEAEHLLISTAQAAGGSLDATALFQAAGLESVIEAGERNEPSPTSPVRVLAPAQAQGKVVQHGSRLPRPRVRVRHRGNTLSVRFLNMPADVKAILSIVGAQRGHRRIVLARMTTRNHAVRLQARPNTMLDISYVPIKTDGASASSMMVIVL